MLQTKILMVSLGSSECPLSIHIIERHTKIIYHKLLSRHIRREE